MTTSNTATSDVLKQEKTGITTVPIQTQASAVSWGAIVAGAAAIAALSLILLILGTGLGLSSVSPWSHNGVSAMTFGVSTILWLTFTQLFASGIGGYLSGRLRTKWIAVHSDEVYFRDTAHGFLAWAVATLATAVILTTVIGSIISGGIQAGATVARGVATTAAAATVSVASTAGSGIVNSNSESSSMDYFIDSLFRKDVSTDSSAVIPATGTLEVARIFINSIQTKNLPEEDIRYIGQVVAQHTDLTQQNAEKRVRDTFTRIQEKLQDAETISKEAADQARKASSYASLWLFISLLIGAFVASFSATYGGRQRDM
ncbi:hypothetical protein [Nitrosomonas sp.]|uniref:hypothetical protein n=1 Tax=Nitrosomonas sp. TaxID=42353 RepID=UPI0025E2A228|nr:hypothetical protein [Nitrosomonas sp.]